MNPHWQRNLIVCLFGSFTTIVAMTLIIPFLPVYVERLGVTGEDAIVQWSGVAFGATFLAAALVSPLWGLLADRFGRKPMLIRASLGMTVTIAMMGLAQNVVQLVLLRLLVGLAGGYASGCVILVATQTPKERSGWALGTLSTGVMAGSLVGPLVGGALPDLIGIRPTFFAAAAVIFLAFLATCVLIREERPRRGGDAASRPRGAAWATITDPRPVVAMLATATLVLFATMSIEPIITVFIGGLGRGLGLSVVGWSGVAMGASALASILAAPRIGRLTDRYGAWPVVIVGLFAAAATLVPQAFVTQAWQLVGLRFAMGIAFAGLLPSITALIRHSVPDRASGAVLGLSQSAQYLGQIAGPLAGGFVAAHYGPRAVFVATSALTLFGAGGNWLVWRRLCAAAQNLSVGEEATGSSVPRASRPAPRAPQHEAR